MIKRLLHYQLVNVTAIAYRLLKIFVTFFGKNLHLFEKIACLVLQKSQWGPSLLKVIPISKTRNGMQFSCAASNVDTHPGTKEVWVCNTDGHVGQVSYF